MKKLAAAGLGAGILATSAILFAPTSFGAASGQAVTDRGDAAKFATSVDMTGPANRAGLRPPVDASMDKFVTLALVSAR